MSNFLSKIFGRDPETGEDALSSGTDFATRAASLLPLGVGVGIGVSRLRSNNPLDVAGISLNSNANIGRTMGDDIRRLNSMKQAASQKSGQKFAERLFRGNQFEQIATEGGDKMKALLSAMTDMIDQSGSPDVANLKQRWTELINEVDNIKQEDVRKMKEAAATIFETMGEADKAEFKKLFTNYQGVASQLQAPVPSLRSTGQVFNPISNTAKEFAGLGGRQAVAEGIFEQVQAMFGAGRVELGSITEGAGKKSLYARVAFPGSGGRSNYLNIPISLARLDNGTSIFRTGSNLTTTYLGRHHYLDALGVQDEFIAGSGKLTKQRIASGVNSLGGAVMSIEEAFFQEVARTVRGRGDANLNAANRRDIYSFFRNLGIGMERGSRPGLLTKHDPEMSKFLTIQAQRQGQTAGIIGMERLSMQEQARFTAQLGSEGLGYTQGASAEVTRTASGRAFGQIAVAGEQSVMGMVRSLGAVDASVLPPTARPRQMVGRTERFVAGNGGVNPVASTLGRGKAIPLFETNLGFAAGNMGGMNTAVIMDLDGGLQRLGLGDGMAYWGAKPNVQTQFTKTVLDPGEISGPSHKLLNDLIERKRSGSGPLKIGPGGNMSIDDFFNTYGAGRKGGAAVLGSLDDRLVELPKYTGLKAMTLELVEDTMAMGRHRYHVSGYMTRSFMDDKVFAQLFKGTTAHMGTSEFSDILGRLGVADTVSGMGLNAQGTMINAGQMLKKAPHYLATQMVSGLALAGDPSQVGGRNAIDRLYAGISDEVSSRLNRRGYANLNAGQQGTAFLEEVISSVGQRMSKMGTGFTSQMAGMIFGGAMNLSKNKVHGLESGRVEELIRTSIAGSHLDSDEVVRQAKRGIAIGATTAVAGTPSTTYRSTLASVEPRYFQMLSHKLQNVLGMSGDATADFLGGMLARKGTTGGELKVLSSLAKTMETMGGVTGLADGAMFGNLPKVSVSDFIASGADAETTEKFLSRFEKGFILDVGDGATGKVARHWENSSQVFIGGAEVLEGLKGARIRQAGEDINIHHEYVRRVNDFARNLSLVDSVQEQRPLAIDKAAQKAGAGFRYEMSQIFGQTWKTLLSGKLRGSTYALGQGISISGANLFAGIGADQAEAMQAVFKRSHGNAGFVSGQAFLDAMRTYMGGATDDIARTGINLKQAQKAASDETRDLFKAFFLGMEDRGIASSAGKAMGIEGMVMRHPLLGPGHMNVMDVFRQDFGAGGADDIFSAWTKTVKGEQALSKLARRSNVSFESLKQGGFSAIADINKRKGMSGAVNRFFGSMAHNISSFSGEGGGKIFFPNMETEVHFTNKKSHTLNLSKAAAMIGDFDGDFYGLQIVSKRRGLLADKVRRELMASTDMLYGMQSELFMEEGKAGIKRLAEAIDSPLTAKQFAFESLQKEFYGKQIGQLDVALDSLRLGMIQGAKSPKEIALAQQGLGLFQMLEEVASIKSKKLPKAMPLAEKTTLAINQLIRSRGEDVAGLKNIVDNIFMGSDLIKKEGMKIDWDATEKAVRKSISGDAMQSQVLSQLKQVENFNLDELMKFTQKSAEMVHDFGLDKLKTIGRSGALAGMSDRQLKNFWQYLIQDANTLRGAMMAGQENSFIEESASRFRDIQRRMSGVSQKSMNRALGPVAIGVAATLGVGAMLGDQGFAPEPLIMPGEISDHRVNQAIASGSFYDQDKNPPQPANLPAGGEANLIGRPLDPSSAYFHKQNAWQIRGEATSMGGMSGITNFISSLGGSSSVRINDARKPITPSYIDRLLTD